MFLCSLICFCVVEFQGRSTSTSVCVYRKGTNYTYYYNLSVKHIFLDWPAISVPLDLIFPITCLHRITCSAEYFTDGGGKRFLEFVDAITGPPREQSYLGRVCVGFFHLQTFLAAQYIGYVCIHEIHTHFCKFWRSSVFADSGCPAEILFLKPILVPNTLKLTAQLRGSRSMEKNSCATLLQYYLELDNPRYTRGQERWSGMPIKHLTNSLASWPLNSWCKTHPEAKNPPRISKNYPTTSQQQDERKA